MWKGHMLYSSNSMEFWGSLNDPTSLGSWVDIRKRKHRGDLGLEDLFLYHILMIGLRHKPMHKCGG